MRKKHVIVAGAITAATLVMSGVTTTPVFAGVTKEQMQAQDDEALKAAFKGVNMGHVDIAYGVLSTVATKTATHDQNNNRYVYAVASDFPLDFRMYFNKNKEGESGKEHALCDGYNVFSIYPNGTGPVAYDDADYDNKIGTDNVGEWPFPDMDGVQTMTRESQIVRRLNSILTNSEVTVLYTDGDQDPASYQNAKGTIDAKKGVFTWLEGLTFAEMDESYYTTYDTDYYGNAYFTSNLTIKNIVGRPGDKLVVNIRNFITSVGNSSWSYADYPVPTLAGGVDVAWEEVSKTPEEGLKVIPGCIYIPYEVTYDMNGATGTAPTVPTGEYFTCDHNTVTVPVKGDLARGDAKLLGWSEEEITDVITDANNIPDDLVEPGGTYTISKNKRSDVKLYAVWGTPASEAAPSLSKRVLQSGSTLIPDMSFTFKFEQLNEWDGVNYVSTAAPIANQTVTVNSSSPRLTTDPFVGDLTGKTLYEGKIDNVLNGYSPTAAGTYAYKVSEVIPDPKAEGVSYTNSEFIMLVEVEDTPSGLKPVMVTNLLYKDSSGKTKTQYATPPAVFDEKHELIFYNNYGTDGGTTPTGIITNNLPFIVIIAGGVGGAVAATVIKAKKRAKR